MAKKTWKQRIEQLKIKEHGLKKEAKNLVEELQQLKLSSKKSEESRYEHE